MLNKQGESDIGLSSGLGSPSYKPLSPWEKRRIGPNSGLTDSTNKVVGILRPDESPTRQDFPIYRRNPDFIGAGSIYIIPRLIMVNQRNK